MQRASAAEPGRRVEGKVEAGVYVYREHVAEARRAGILIYDFTKKFTIYRIDRIVSFGN